MTTAIKSKRITLRGCNCTVELKPEGNGFSYDVFQNMPRGNRVLFCSGWTAGTRAEAIREATDNATSMLKRIQDDTL